MTVTLAQAKRMRFAWASGIDTLYKFRSFQGEARQWVAEMLLESKVYFSHPDEFNDPFDIAPVVRHGGNPKDPAYLKELQDDQTRHYLQRGFSAAEIADLRQSTGVSAEALPEAGTRDMRQQIRNTARILCLSATQLDPLQWAHYANGHQGVCIHFRCDRRTWLEGARSVRYRVRRPAIMLPMSRQSSMEMAHRIALTKANFWRYENEYRAFASRDPRSEITLTGSYFHFAPSDIRGITIGMSMKAADRSALSEILNQRRQAIPIWECVEDRNRYAVKLRKADWSNHIALNERAAVAFHVSTDSRAHNRQAFC